MQAQGAAAAILVATALVGCDFESPGAVAAESPWSAVPANSSEQGRPEREGRLADVAELEERAARLQGRLDRVTARRHSASMQGSDDEALEALSRELEAVGDELRALRDLTGDGAPFRRRFERVEAQLADVETRLSSQVPSLPISEEGPVEPASEEVPAR